MVVFALEKWYNIYMEKRVMSVDLSSMSREELESNYVNLQTELEAEKLKVSWLEEQFRLQRAVRFGASSEKTLVDFNQMSIFNEAEYLCDEAGVLNEPAMIDVAPTRKKKKGTKNRLTAGLPKERFEFDLTEEEKTCSTCGNPLHYVKKVVRKELAIIPAKVYVKEYISHVYACRKCQETGDANPMHTAKAPLSLFNGSLASASIVADIIKKKYIDCTPLYRQEQDVKRNGLKLTRQTMSNWVINASNKYFQPIYEKMLSRLLEEDIIQADETELEVLNEPGKEAKSKSYMWLFRTNRESKPIVLYKYADTRAGRVAGETLKNFNGYLQTDGYSGYNSVTLRDENPATPVGCFAHARRKYCDALKALPAVEQQNPNTNIAKGIAYCDKIFNIEKQLSKLSPQERQLVRQEKMMPLLEEYFGWVKRFDPSILLKSKFRDAIVYSINQEIPLRNFMLDGRLECSNNRSERSIKPFVIARKNFLFCNTPSGANASAVTFSIVETAKENNLNIFNYLEHILECMSQDEAYDIEKLMPWSDELPEDCKAKRVSE